LYAIGRTALSKRAIWMVRVSAAPVKDDLRHTFRVLVICRQHGDEPVSTETALAILHSFAVSPQRRLREVLGDTTLYIVPMANPDGADALKRENGVGADLNRDWGRFTQPETRAVYDAYRMIKPQAVLDMHSWTPDDSFQANSIEVATPTGVADYSDMKAMSLQNEIITTAQQRSGLDVTAFEFGPGCDPTLAHRYFAKIGAVSMLVETASGWSTAGAMSARMALDETALRTVLADIRRDPAGWRRVAAAQQTVVAPKSAYTTSSSVFLPKIMQERLREADALADAATSRIDKTRLKLVGWTLGIYLIACLVLLRFAGRIAMQSIRKLRENLSHRKAKATTYAPIYVSVHRRHFPDSPVDIGFRPASRSTRFDLRFNQGEVANDSSETLTETASKRAA
jgi:hypothetical protein